jgi:hypothetical protein
MYGVVSIIHHNYVTIVIILLLLLGLSWDLHWSSSIFWRAWWWQIGKSVIVYSQIKF